MLAIPCGAMFRVLILSCFLLVGPVHAERYPFFNIGIEQGLIQSQVSSLVQDNAGHLWAGTLGGLSCFDGQKFRSFTVRDGLPSNSINTLACDSQGNLWIGTTKGLSRFDGHQFTNYRFAGPDNPSGNIVVQITISTEGLVWCMANRSLYLLKNGKSEAVALPVGHSELSCILDDHHGGLYAGLRDNPQLFHFSNKLWDSCLVDGNTPVSRLYYDDGKHLIVLKSAALYRQNSGEWQVLYESKGIPSNQLLSFSQSNDESYWLSTTQGVILLSEGKVLRFDKQNGLTDLEVQFIYPDREGNIWFGTNGEGLYRFSGAIFTSIDESMGLTGPQVSSIAEDDHGIIYFGSYDGGLYQYKNQMIQAISFPGLGLRSHVTSLAILGNTLFIGTQSHGLWKYQLSNGSLKRYQDERIGKSIPAMLRDSNVLWVASNSGLIRIDRDSSHSRLFKMPVVDALCKIGNDSVLLASGEGLKLCTHDTIRDFTTGTSADSGQIICMTARDGIVWIGTIDNGVIGYELSSHKTYHVTRKNGLHSNFIYSIYAASNHLVWVGTGFGICCINTAYKQPMVRFYGRNAGLTGMESNRNAVYPMKDGSIWFGTTGGALLYHPENTQAFTKAISLQLQSLLIFGEPIHDSSWYKGLNGIYGIPIDLRLPWQKNNITFTFQAIILTGSDNIQYRYRLDGLNAPWSEWSPNNTVNFSALPPGNYTLEVQCSTDGIIAQAEQLRYDFEIITPFQKTFLFKLLVLAACILLGVSLQYITARRKRARLAMIEALRREEQAKVRQRTAEDFHDEVGNKLTRINVLTNVLRSKISTGSTDAIRIIDQIQDNAGQLYSGTRDILWSLQPSNDTLYQVLQRIGDFGQDLFGDTEISFEISGIDPAWKEVHLPIDISRNLIMIFKEALNNVLKYAMADQTEIKISNRDGILHIALMDNGKGFDPAQISSGQGLINMSTRASRLGGQLDIKSKIGKGTQIDLFLKIPSNKG